MAGIHLVFPIFLFFRNNTISRWGAWLKHSKAHHRKCTHIELEVPIALVYMDNFSER